MILKAEKLLAGLSREPDVPTDHRSSATISISLQQAHRMRAGGDLPPYIELRVRAALQHLLTKVKASGHSWDRGSLYFDRAQLKEPPPPTKPMWLLTVVWRR